ncbi:hypothetical protein [Dendronalium sp. ChiSLP03b]|uniref:hypothetical protein n=1 Tax=Dendronalium sp. ChiSLP03b TaxID=3075381 RepID=UPI002AD5C3AA|nr:hypothetical protein [Dendronalium sp. ChiSLP03b]
MALASPGSRDGAKSVSESSPKGRRYANDRHERHPFCVAVPLLLSKLRAVPPLGEE